MTTEPLAPPTEPGPDTGIEGNRTDNDHTRQELGATIGASSAKDGVTGLTKAKVAEAQDRIPETTIPTTDVLVENGHTAQSTARDSRAFRATSVEPAVCSLRR